MVVSQDLAIEEYVLDTPKRFGASMQRGLKMAAKCYTRKDIGSLKSGDAEGFTLIFCHGLGSHKEQWEPTLFRLFTMQNTENPGDCSIREAWAFDWQSHGDSGVLNRSALISRSTKAATTKPNHLALREWAAALKEFIHSPRMAGHQLVLIGHCVGMTALTHAISDRRICPSIKTLIMVDPIIITEQAWKADLEKREGVMNHLLQETSARPDTWDSKEKAYVYFSRRYPWKQWNKEVLKVFVDEGLQPTSSGGCELKCTKEQEALHFLDRWVYAESTAHISRLSQDISTHIIWGERHDNVSKEMQDVSLEPFKHRVSQTTIQNCGHMIIQEQPKVLASLINAILTEVRVADGKRNGKVANKL
ncbi:alpha/beta-hydrolase [Pholiota conissans]|uniref:Alpha/beta-hydrolase n=1 Tax=Pholiota conissans TaxID=109636 RepID=A0A9P6CZ13_9AGAR|nr:alpha/beta-hydrolase [Pholiota conissans]